MRLPAIALVFLAAGGVAVAQPAPFDPQRLAHPPGEAEARAVVAQAGAVGWEATAAQLENAALDLHRRAARTGQAWWNAARVAAFLAQSERAALVAWREALLAANHPLRVSEEVRRAPLEPLAASLDPELAVRLFAEPAFAEEFLGILSPLDNPLEVVAILNALHRADPDGVRRLPRVALAIAVVHDTAPPPWWPHAQVGEVLPRRLRSPEAVFADLQGLVGRAGVANDPARLPAYVLRFLVDQVLPDEEVAWVRETQRFPRRDWDRLYTQVAYDHARLDRGEYTWPRPAYRMRDILAHGGICVDQAYFAMQAGKVLGLPTLVFAGAGADSRHAWFGYYDERRGWNMDSGRGDDAVFVSGRAIDPQTWLHLTEHEVRFLADGFRATDAYRASVYQATIAQAWQRRGLREQAQRAARAAVALDHRNRAGWEVLVRLADEGEAARAQRIHVLAEATRSFGLYPDLELAYAVRLMDAWTEAGQTSLVDAEQVRLLRKFERERPDLSVRLARDMVESTFSSPIPGASARAYERALETLGRGAGIKLYDALVPWYIERVRGDREAVLRAILLARRHLRPPPGSQMDQELADLERGSAKDS